MIGTLVNVLTITVGSIIGIAFNKKIPTRFIDITFQGIGIFTLGLGISMAIKGQNPLFMIFSLILGAIIGEYIDIDGRLNSIGDKLKHLLKSNNSNFTDGLVTTFLLFCVGSMTILGAIEEGIYGNSQLLITKATMDGFASIALASALGIGVLFSVVPLFIFQGSLTLLASYLEPFLSDVMINELSAVGGLLLIGLSLNILEIKKIKVTNMLPSLIVIILFMIFLPSLSWH